MNAWTIPLALFRGVVESAVVILLVMTLVRLFPRWSAGVHAALWWLASARALVAFVPGLDLALAPPAMLSRAGAWWPAPVADVGGAAATARYAAGLAAAPATIPVAPHAPWIAAAWLPNVAAALVTGLWFTGMVVIAARWFAARRKLERVWRNAEPVSYDVLGLSPKSGGWVSGVPEVRCSHSIAVPLAFGIRRPRILVPTNGPTLHRRALALAVAHELAHVRRGDLVWCWLPALARLVFWFDPIVAWCAREYAEAREQACDAEALAAMDASPREYGELLLAFGVARTPAMPLVAALDSRTARGLERRLERLATPRGVGRLARLGGAAAIVLVMTALVPVHGAWGHERSGEPATRDAAKDANRFFYFFHRAGEKGTRGSVTMSDMELAERLVRERDIDFWCVREGAHSWLIVDPQIIEQARDELAPMDSVEALRTPIEHDMRDLEHASEPARYGIDAIDRAIDSVNAAIDRDREWAAYHRERADAARRADEIADLEARRERLQGERERHERTTQKLDSEREDLYRRSMRLYDSAEALRPAIDERMRKIAKEAIASGRAERVH